MALSARSSAAPGEFHGFVPGTHGRLKPRTVKPYLPRDAVAAIVHAIHKWSSWSSMNHRKNLLTPANFIK
jgi:hypothetical protein